MKYNKIGFLMILLFAISWLSGCAGISKLVIGSDEEYQTSIEHQIYNEQLSTEASVLAIYNQLGNIKFIGSEAKEISINVTIRQTKKINDLEKNCRIY